MPIQVQVWNITGKSGFHFGSHGLGQEESRAYIPSDTLLSAFLASLAQAGSAGDILVWVNLLRADPPPFVITSAFPRAGDVLFFPAPLAALRAVPGQDPKTEFKSLKKVKYVSEQVFNLLLSGNSLDELFNPKNSLHNGSMLFDEVEKDKLPTAVLEGGKIWSTDTRSRVTIDRVSNSSSLYHIGETRFSAECGLWFGVRWLSQQAELQPKMERVFDQLGDSGLGGERSAGYGGAKIIINRQIELPHADGGSWVTLSRYLPCADEMPALGSESAAYQLESVSGWVQSFGSPAQRRRALNLLVEGSVLGPLDRAVPGQIVDVAPVYEVKGKGEITPIGHPVYRSGLAFAVGMTK